MEELILHQSLQGEGIGQERRVEVPPVCSQEAEREMQTCAQFSFSFLGMRRRPQRMKECYPQSEELFLPSTVKVLWKSSHRDAQKSGFLVILNLVKLPVKINHK